MYIFFIFVYVCNIFLYFRDLYLQVWLDDYGKDFGVFIDGKWVKLEGRKKYLIKNLVIGILILQINFYNLLRFEIGFLRGKYQVWVRLFENVIG